MSLVLDILLILTVVIALVSGLKRGFIKTVMNLISIIIALLCGYAFTPQLADYYAENIFLSRFTASIEQAISNLLEGGLDGITKWDLGQLFSEKPEAFSGIIDRYQGNMGDLEGYYHTQMAAGSQNITESLSLQIAEPLANVLSNVLAFLTIFLAAMLLLKIITVILDLVFNLPGLKKFNRLFGMILGLLCGLVYAMVLSRVMIAAVPVLSSVFPDVIPADAAAGSFIIGLIEKYNIFTLFF